MYYKSGNRNNTDRWFFVMVTATRDQNQPNKMATYLVELKFTRENGVMYQFLIQISRYFYSLRIAREKNI